MCAKRAKMGSQQRKVKLNQVKANWTPELHEIFIDLCLEQISLGNRPGTCFNKEGWMNIMNSFHTLTSLPYEKVQLKNHLDVTKKHWTTWHHLVCNDTMKWDAETRKFGASDEEWTEYLDANPDAAQFRFKELLFADKLDIIFGVTAGSGGIVRPTRRRRQTYGSALTLPSTRPKKHHNYLTVRESPTHFAKHQDDSMKTRFHAVEPVAIVPNSTMDRCYEAVESKSFMTIQSPSLPRLTYSIEECINCLDSIEEIEQGGELYLFALDIFLKQEYREIFLNLKKSSTRIAWLERLQTVGPQLAFNSEA